MNSVVDGEKKGIVSAVISELQMSADVTLASLSEELL